MKAAAWLAAGLIFAQASAFAQPEDTLETPSPAEIADHLENAENLIGVRNFASAKAELSDAFAVMGDDDASRLIYYEKMGRIALAQNDEPGARAQYLAGLKLAKQMGSHDPVVADLYGGVGECLIVEQNKDYAARYLQRALESNPTPQTRARLSKLLNDVLRGQAGPPPAAAPIAAAGAEPRSPSPRAPDSTIGAGTWSLGLNYPGLGARYFVSDNFAVEAKGQSQSGDDVAGVRLYRYFRPAPRIFLFLGGEGGYVWFKGSVTKGTGYEGEGFGGLEYFVLPHVGVQADFGPAYVYLKDKSTALSAGGLEYVVNFGFNYYFGK